MSQSNSSTPSPDELDFSDLEPLDSPEALPDLPDDAVLEEVPAKPTPPRPAPAAQAPAKPEPPAKPKAPAKPEAPAKPAGRPKPVVPKKPVVRPKAAVKPAAPARPAPVEAASSQEPEAALVEEEAAAPAANVATAGGVQLRELDKAPRHLRTASIIVILGSLFPWMGHGGTWMTAAVAKLVMVAGFALLWMYWKYRAGESVSGFVAKLSEISLLPAKKADEDDGKKKRRAKRDAGPDLDAILRGKPFPTAIHLLAIALIIGGVFVPMLDAPVAEAGTFGKAAAELGMMAWGLATWVHIFAFERGGKFNPIFPLMYIGHAIAGILGVISGLGTMAIFQILGGAGVGAGGLFAGYTIIEALKEAKADGDRKKAAAAEARKAARKRG